MGPIVNAFIEDTCVLAVIAWLLARGRLVGVLFSDERNRNGDRLLGVLLGLIAVTEFIFPGLRAPYMLHTLIVAFGVMVGGLRVGAIAIVVATIGATLFQSIGVAFDALISLTVCLLAADVPTRLIPDRCGVVRALAVGALGQGAVVLLHGLPLGALHPGHDLTFAVASVPANGFGVLLLQVIVADARTRAASEVHRLQAERAQTLVSQAQLAALRARVHPHFLFNALTSVAALCGIAPDRAEEATLKLGQIMRRALESDPEAPITLANELEYVHGYLDSEQFRFGGKLTILWEIEPDSLAVIVPAFGLQTLVENAVLHGASAKVGPGTVRVTARVRRGRAIIAVIDDGVGITSEARAGVNAAGAKREHGLRILTQQLILLYGPRARLRLFGAADRGTLAAFGVPAPTGVAEGVTGC